MALFLAATLVPASAFAAGPLDVKPGEKIWIVAPHPDDEALGAGGFIQAAVAAGASVRVVYLTQGDLYALRPVSMRSPLKFEPGYLKSGQTRRLEAERAMSRLKVPPENLVFFGYPDLGLLSVWRWHWGAAKPYRSLATRANKVPYRESASYQKLFKGESVIEDLKRLFAAEPPSRVFVTAPFDSHPDHQAAWLFTQAALYDLESGIPAPEVFVFDVHLPHWVGDAREAAPRAAETWGVSEWIEFPLTAAQRSQKKNALLQYSSQMRRKRFLLSFVRVNERFGRWGSPETLTSSAMPPFGESAAPPPAGHLDVNCALYGGEFWTDVRFKGPIDEIGTLDVELYSWRRGRPFESMPKIHLRLFGKKLFVYDGKRRLRNARVLYMAGTGHFTVRVPLDLLGSPERVFASVTASKRETVPAAWRVYEIAPAPKA